MRKLILILSLMPISIYCFCQSDGYKPFNLNVITPDTMSIHSSLNHYIDTIENQRLRGYYQYIKKLERILASPIEYPPGMEKEGEQSIKETKSELDSLRKWEEKFKSFKYYQTISEGTAEILHFSFASGKIPNPKIQTSTYVKPTLNNIQIVSDSLNADYIVAFKNIYTEMNGNEIKMYATVIFYSNKENKIIVEKEIVGDTQNNGGMWSCSNPLSCLISNCIKNSINSYFNIIDELELY